MSFTLSSNKTPSIREFLLARIALPAVLVYRNLFKRRKIKWGENREKLKTQPLGSIGKLLSDFLFENDIHLEPKMENHDFLHVVLGYNTSLPEEAALHFFLIGNTKGSHYPFIAAFVGFAFFPEHYKLYIEAYNRGRCTTHFAHWNLKQFLSTDLVHFQRSIKIPQRRNNLESNEKRNLRT